MLAKYDTTDLQNSPKAPARRTPIPEDASEALKSCTLMAASARTMLHNIIIASKGFIVIRFSGYTSSRSASGTPRMYLLKMYLGVSSVSSGMLSASPLTERELTESELCLPRHY